MHIAVAARWSTGTRTVPRVGEYGVYAVYTGMYTGVCTRERYVHGVHAVPDTCVLPYLCFYRSFSSFTACLFYRMSLFYGAAVRVRSLLRCGSAREVSFTHVYRMFPLFTACSHLTQRELRLKAACLKVYYYLCFMCFTCLRFYVYVLRVLRFYVFYRG